MAAGLREHLVAYFEEHQKLVEAGALRLLLETHQPLVVSREILERAGAGSGFVTESMVASVLSGRRPSARSGAVAAAPIGPDPSVDGFRLLVEGFVSTPASGAPIDSYGVLFRSRYRALQRLLKGRPSLPDLRPIRDLRPVDGGASVIGMVREIRETSKRHHLIITLDDETGSIETLVPKDSAGARLPFLPDEVVGLKLQFGRELGKIPVAIAVERPDVPADRALARSSRGRRAIFLSDLHIGSRSFLAESWARLVDFLHEKGPYPELARSIDSVVVAGDLVDGIGIYPRQERDLAILDIVEQYNELGRRLAELPARLTIVVVPGNHDAVCPAEPQPPLPTVLVQCLPGNVHALSNPSTFALDGVVIEAYHGRSFDDLIPAIPGSSYSRPTEVMRRMLQMRHLGPIYGDRTPLAPLARDGLVIDPAPDILVTGHLHTYGVDRYRGVLMMNVSTWQAETEYQRMRNIVPVPSRAAIVDLSSLGLVTLDCSNGTAIEGGRGE
ncbi:MAG: metallophosphoesterase [Thermoplasmata archaeon]